MLAKIKERMRERHISQRELSRITGIGYDRIHHILNREDSMRVREFFAICDALGIENPREVTQ